MTSETNLAQLRSNAGLPEFQHDVFVSFRFGDSGMAKLRHLETYLNEQFGIKLTAFREPRAALPDIQKEAINSSRVVIFLLEQARGLYNVRDDDGTGYWGQQYAEMQAIVKLYGEVESNLYGESKLEKERALPLILVYYFYASGSDEPSRAIHGLLPTDHSDKPAMMDAVRKFFASGDSPCVWRPFQEAGANDQHAAWHRDAVSAIITGFRTRGQSFSTGKVSLHEVATDVRAVPMFDHASYVRRRREFWEEGFSYVPQGKSSSDWEAFGSFPVATRDRIRLWGVLHKIGSAAASMDLPMAERRDVRSELVGGDSSLWVLGPPGSGKTTVITQSAAAEIEHSSRFPFVFSLKRFSNALGDGEQASRPMLSTLMAQDIADDGEQCTADMLADFLQNHPCSLYLDGFDELGDAARRTIVDLIKEERSNWHIRTRLIISCRAGYEGNHFEWLSKLWLQALSVDDLDGFVAQRTSNLASFAANSLNKKLEPLRKAFLHLSSDVDPLRTPFFLMLILNDDATDGALSGSGPMVFAGALSRFFKRLRAGAQTDIGDKNFDVIEALTTLAVAHIENRTIDEDLLAEVTRGNTLGTASEMKGLRNRRQMFLRKQSAVLRRDDANGHYVFTHSIFAEYLVAVSLALKWYKASSIEGARSDRERAEEQVLNSLLSANAAFGKFASLELIERIPCIFFDEAMFPDLKDGPDGSEASQLAREFCYAVMQHARNIAFDRERGDERGAGFFLSAIRAVHGVCDPHHGMRKADLDVCLELIQLIYRSRFYDWRPREREAIMAAIASLDIDSWATISGALKGPILLAGGNVRVPVWRENGRSVDMPQLAVDRKPVLVSEYVEFSVAPDRYDNEFWPHRSAEESDAARKDLIQPLREGRLEAVGAHSEAKFCIIGDLRTEISEHWREQQRFPYRPVTNIAWREAVAYALWRSKRSRRDLRLPGLAEWSQIISAVGASGHTEARQIRRDIPLTNDGTAGLYSPSTIGVFPPNSLELLDFGSNVAIWLATHNNDFRTLWPPVDSAELVQFCGASYLTSDQRRVTDAYRRYRKPWIGMWLVEYLQH